MKFNRSPHAVFWACVAMSPLHASSQDYPSQPIQFVVPGTPGITGDVLARLLATKISQRWNVPVTVENKAGAGGSLGMQSVAKAEPNGYTFLVANTSYGTLTALNKLPPDFAKRLVPISLLGTSAMTLVVTNSFPANNVREFIEQAKRRPGIYNFASPGIGAIQHMAMEMLIQEAAINLTHVPYKGTAGGLNDLAAGHVHVGVVSLPSATPMVKSGKLRMLAVMGSKRATQFPDVPTMAEAGFPALVVETWNGLLAPHGVSRQVTAKMNAEIDELLKLPDVKEALLRQGVEPVGGKPEVLESLLRDEIALWTRVVIRGKIIAE